MFSGGISSFEAARRCIGKHGRNAVELWFADTKTEDDDLYRFLDDCEKFLGVKVERFAEGRNVWQVFTDKRMLGNTQFDPCSRILKRELLRKVLRERYPDPASSIIILGLDWTEPQRVERNTAAFKPYRTSFPLLEIPLLLKSDLVEFVRSLGIRPPRLTEMGFPHNNCGGFCIKAGHAQFAHLLRSMPERYAYHEAKEAEWQQVTGLKYTVLSDRHGGKRTPLSLVEFRHRIQVGMFDETDWGGCGCFTEP